MAKKLKNTIIVLMFEPLNWYEKGDVGYIISGQITFKCFGEYEIFSTWSGTLFDSIVTELKEKLTINSSKAKSMDINFEKILL